jgi:GTP 3',8-cyclase
MMIDFLGRSITYLRISVTDRCNYRCTYCMPEAGIDLIPHGRILRYEQIAAITHIAGRMGITKIRLTGGEPLVKRDIETLVRLIANSWHFNEVCMTTNGSLLTPAKAFALKAAGLRGVNISLDTLNAERFAFLTRGGNIQEVLAGIRAAQAARLAPVKINMVVLDDTTDDEILNMESFCASNGLELQTIARFSLTNRTISFARQAAAHRPPDCAACNRLRLTSDGYLKPCLFSDNEIRIDFSDIEGCFKAAVKAKPRCGIRCSNRSMSQVGG